MEHPEVANETPFFGDVLHLEDENGAFVCCPVVKATYEIHTGGRLALSVKQRPLNLAGVFWGDPQISSYRHEPESAFIKLATDVVLIGEAHAPQPGTQTVDVGLKVGPVQKIVRVFGNRYWVKTGGSVIATKPQPFERIPLIYERAFGGWDMANADKAAWRCERRNPVGKGFGDPLRYVEEGKVPMPNLEDPNQPIKRYGDAPPPAGFGFVSPSWFSRAQYAGTYDAAWEKARKPLLPQDFDRRFFNAASPGLIAPGYLKGNEDVVIVNASLQPQLRFNLPAVGSLLCVLEKRGGNAETLRMNLDTVVIDLLDGLVTMLWRVCTLLPNGPFDLSAVRLAFDSNAPGR